VTEQIRGRAPPDQVAVQDRVHLVLQPSALTHDMRPAQHLAAQRAGRGIRTPHRRQIVRGPQLSQNLGVDLSVLTFASAIALVLAGLDTTTRPARLANTVEIAQVFPVASNATSSPGPRPSANARTPSGVVANLPAWVTSPHSQIATCANSRCTSSPMHRRCVCVCTATLPPTITTTMIGRGWAKRHQRIRARSATGQVAGAANY
jgi:hypothetical protein